MVGDISVSEPIQNDATDNDPMDEGLQIIKMHGYPPVDQQGEFYKCAKDVRNKKYHKSLLMAIIGNLSFWMYILLEFIRGFLP